MSMMIQIRNVPEALHRRLKARAAMEGMSMSLYVRREIERSLARPSQRAVIEAIRREPEITLEALPADVLREQRESR